MRSRDTPWRYAPYIALDGSEVPCYRRGVGWEWTIQRDHGWWYETNQRVSGPHRTAMLAMMEAE